MDRRQFLGAAAALAALPDPHDDATDETVPTPRSAPLLDEAFTHMFVERYDEGGRVRVETYAHTPEPVVAELTLGGDWGEAGVGLTPDEARTVGRRLLNAARAADR